MKNFWIILYFLTIPIFAQFANFFPFPPCFDTHENAIASRSFFDSVCSNQYGRITSWSISKIDNLWCIAAHCNSCGTFYEQLIKPSCCDQEKIPKPKSYFQCIEVPYRGIGLSEAKPLLLSSDVKDWCTNQPDFTCGINSSNSSNTDDKTSSSSNDDNLEFSSSGGGGSSSSGGGGSSSSGDDDDGDYGEDSPSICGATTSELTPVLTSMIYECEFTFKGKHSYSIARSDNGGFCIIGECEYPDEAPDIEGDSSSSGEPPIICAANRYNLSETITGLINACIVGKPGYAHNYAIEYVSDNPPDRPFCIIGGCNAFGGDNSADEGTSNFDPELCSVKVYDFDYDSASDYLAGCSAQYRYGLGNAHICSGLTFLERHPKMDYMLIRALSPYCQSIAINNFKYSEESGEYYYAGRIATVDIFEQTRHYSSIEESIFCEKPESPWTSHGLDPLFSYRTLSYNFDSYFVCNSNLPSYMFGNQVWPSSLLQCYKLSAAGTTSNRPYHGYFCKESVVSIASSPSLSSSRLCFDTLDELFVEFDKLFATCHPYASSYRPDRIPFFGGGKYCLLGSCSVLLDTLSCFADLPKAHSVRSELSAACPDYIYNLHHYDSTWYNHFGRYVTKPPMYCVVGTPRRENSSCPANVSSSSSYSLSSSSFVSYSSSSPTGSDCPSCKPFVAGPHNSYAPEEVFTSGLHNMAAGKCYGLNPDRGAQHGWINTNAQDSWWWEERPCDGSAPVEPVTPNGCKYNKRGPNAVYTANDCFSDGLDNMRPGKCYSLNPDRGTQHGWISNDAGDSWWWVEVPCGFGFFQKKHISQEKSPEEEPSDKMRHIQPEFFYDAVGRKTTVRPETRRVLFSPKKKSGNEQK